MVYNHSEWPEQCPNMVENWLKLMLSDGIKCHPAMVSVSVAVSHWLRVPCNVTISGFSPPSRSMDAWRGEGSDNAMPRRNVSVLL